MAADNVSSLTYFFKTKFRDKLVNDVPTGAGPIAANVMKRARSEPAGGRTLDTTWAYKSYDGVGEKAMTEAADLPEPLQSGALNATLALCHMGFAVGVTGHAEAMGSKPEFSWLRKKIAKEKGEEIRNKLASRMGRFMVWNGTANFGTIATGGVSGNVITVTGCSVKMFHKGEQIGCYTATSGGTNHLASAAAGRIVDIDELNNTLTLADATGATAADVLSPVGYYDATVPNGLRNICLNTGTIQGMVRSTAGYNLAKANVINFGSVSLGPTHMDQIRDLVEDVVDDREVSRTSTWACNRKFRRWAQLATIGQNRFADLNLAMGVPQMSVADKNGKKILTEDPRILDGEVYVYDAGEFVKVEPEGMEGGYPLENADGSVFFQANAASGSGHKDERRMYWMLRYNVGNDNFRGQAYGYGLLSP